MPRSLYLSCGHNVDVWEDARTTWVKDVNKEGGNAISYKTLCPNCYKDSEEHGEVFSTEENALSWVGVKKKLV